MNTKGAIWMFTKYFLIHYKMVLPKAIPLVHSLMKNAYEIFQNTLNTETMTILRRYRQMNFITHQSDIICPTPIPKIEFILQL